EGTPSAEIVVRPVQVMDLGIEVVDEIQIEIGNGKYALPFAVVRRKGFARPEVRTHLRVLDKSLVELVQVLGDDPVGLAVEGLPQLEDLTVDEDRPGAREEEGQDRRHHRQEFGWLRQSVFPKRPYPPTH